MAERGVVLWMTSLLLGLLAWLAAATLQQAAHAALQARAEAQVWQARWQADALAGRLSRLPVPTADAAASDPWQPSRLPGQAAGALLPRGRETALRAGSAPATMLSPGQRAWSLTRQPLQPGDLGEGQSILPGDDLQRWQLQVSVRPGRLPARSWRYDFLQRSSP